MPESPEVQALAEFLYDRTVGRGIRSIEMLDHRALQTRKPDPHVLEGSRVAGVLRFGKHVDIDAGEWRLVIAFGRHGWVRWRNAGEQDASHGDPPAVVRVRFDDDSVLELTDAGQFRSAGIHVVADPADVKGIVKLGPDPADPTFTRGDFERAVRTRRKQIKALLQEQESFAGIGNAYSDEILHVARLSPTVHAADLDADERDRLFTATRQVILGAIDDRRGVPIDRMKAEKVAAMRVHGRAGEPCPVCGTAIAEFGNGDSSAQHCPTCQGGTVPV